MATSAPATDWFHKFLLSLEHLVGLHPDDPNYAAQQAEIAKITKDSLSQNELDQLDRTLAAIEASRVAPAPVPNPAVAPVATVSAPVAAAAPPAPVPVDLAAKYPVPTPAQPATKVVVPPVA